MGLQFAEEYKSIGEREWYFFSPRDRKYPNGTRPNRSAQDGFWKATGKEISILSEGSVIGKWRTMVFCEGDRPNGTKTDWLMREYTLVGPSHNRTSAGDMKVSNRIMSNSSLFILVPPPLFP